MFIRCKKTGEEYEITDREIGEKVECPCCGDKFVVDDLIISDAAYTAALIRKTEAVMLRNEPKQALYKHGTESSAALLFDRAYEYRDAEAQFQLAKWLFDNEREYALAAFWFECAAAKKHPEATHRFAECLWNGIGIRKNIDRAVVEYRNAAKYGCDAAKGKAAKFDFAEYNERKAGGKATFAAVQKMIGDAKKFEGYLCAKYNVRGVMLFWSDDALPEWGTSKGTSIIIGSFKSEKDVPREMLEEISHLIGRSLSYTGRYVDNGVADEEKFLFCYAVYPTDEEYDDEIDSAGADAISHISLLLQRELDDESGESKRRAITWRETIDMNCPLCEGKITLPTRLMGSRVRCSHCKGEFVAKGEGIMTTAERKDFREHRKWSAEANDIEQNCMRPEGCIVSALRLGLNMGRYSIELESVGCGYSHPWPGVYVVMQFTDEDDSRRVNACKTLEFGLGFWARWTKTECAYDKFSYTFYIRKNRPCEQNVHAKIEIEERKLKIEQQMKAQSAEQANAAISAREAEYERLKYLIYGESELTNNYFDFQQYMYDRYHVAVVNVFNDRADDPFCKSFGFKDGFGIVVDTREALKGEQFAMLVSDLEKRICRKVTLVKKGFLGDVFKYCFVPSMPDQSARQSEKPVGSQIAARTRNERSVTMKRNTTTTTPRMTTPNVSSKAKNGQSSKSRMRFFTHPHDNNKIIATWDLDADKIKMYRGATTEFFFRAVCGYRAWKYAKSESLAGRSALMQKLLKLAETVPVGLKSRIVGKYSDSSPDTIIGETFLYAFGCSGRNSIEELLRSAEDMEWYNRYCQAIKEALAGAAARDMGIYLGSVDELAKIAPDDFVRMFIRRVSESDKAKKQEKPKPKEIKPLGRGEPNEFGIWAQKIAVDHLDDLFAKYNARVSDQFCQFRWIKKDRTSQSFEHFAFAYKNAVFAVLVNVVCGENAIAAMCGTKSMLSSDGQQRLCRESLRYNLVPCILDVVLSETDNEYTLQIADNKDWGLRHAKTGALIDPFEFGKNADTPMSDWELQNFAIVVAKNAFKGESVVDSYCDIPGAAPSMWFHDKAGHKAWAIVRFQRVLDESAANDYRDFVKKNPHLSSYDGFFIPVSAAVADAVLKDRNGHVIPLSKRFDGTAPIYRGHGLYVNFKRIIKIHNAEMQGAKKTGEGFFASFKKCVAKLLRRKQSTVTIICGAVMAATEELVCKDILKMKTSISSRLQMPSVKQYIAGALLNVISYTSSKSKQTCAFDGNKFMQALSQKYGKFCKIGYAQTEEMARELERTGAPTLSIAANYPIVARCIVAEIVIQGFLQRKIPTDEFDVFRREFLSVAESLWSDISSRQNVCRL